MVSTGYEKQGDKIYKPNPAEKGYATFSVDHLEVFLPQKAEITKIGIREGKKEINPALKFLATQKKIGWDFMGTIILGPATNVIQKFIKDHPEIEHYLITSTSTQDIKKEVIPDLKTG